MTNAHDIELFRLDKGTTAPSAMGFLSILPEYLSPVETWIGRVFVSRSKRVQHTFHNAKLSQLVLAILTVGPWLLVLLYDLVLYIWRSATYELPGIGGRARGRHRPRAPSLTERPSGHKRQFSLTSVPRQHSELDHAATTTSSKHASYGTVPRTTHETAEG